MKNFWKGHRGDHQMFNHRSSKQNVLSWRRPKSVRTTGEEKKTNKGNLRTQKGGHLSLKRVKKKKKFSLIKNLDTKICENDGIKFESSWLHSSRSHFPENHETSAPGQKRRNAKSLRCWQVGIMWNDWLTGWFRLSVPGFFVLLFFVVFFACLCVFL